MNTRSQIALHSVKLYQPNSKRLSTLGKLIVVGGPGGSGASTIAKHLSKYYGLSYVYAGNIMRRIAEEYNLTLEQFLESEYFQNNSHRIDKLVDEKCIIASYQKDVLIDSKSFALIAYTARIPTTVKIWINANLDVRAKRIMDREYSELIKDSVEYKEKLLIVKKELTKRFSNDRKRFTTLYGLDYADYKKYNDIVIDASYLNKAQVLNKVLQMIKDGRYIT